MYGWLESWSSNRRPDTEELGASRSVRRSFSNNLKSSSAVLVASGEVVELVVEVVYLAVGGVDLTLAVVEHVYPCFKVASKALINGGNSSNIVSQTTSRFMSK